MIINRRRMGERYGYWTGKEVEHTQFYGKETLFISRWDVTESALAKFPDVEHVFFAPINPLFSASSIKYNYLRLEAKVQELLEKGYCVTVEVSATNVLKTYFNDARRMYPATFCLLLVVEVPQLSLGG